MLELLLTNAAVATMADDCPFGLVRDGAVGIENGKIAWMGRAADKAGAREEHRDLCNLSACRALPSVAGRSATCLHGASWP
jgi:cytosine/adenosine deaminase-related metal-dependent hydrolase